MDKIGFYMHGNSINALQGGMRHDILVGNTSAALSEAYDIIDHLYHMVMILDRQVEELEDKVKGE